MTTWVDFTRRNDPACKAGVRRFEKNLLKYGYPDIFCFWSKAPDVIYELYKDHIIDLKENGTLVLGQFTVNNYGNDIEPNVPKVRLDRITNLLGSDDIRLRFDPIIGGYTKSHHFTKTLELAQKCQIKRIIVNFIELKYKNVGLRFKEHGVDVKNINDKVKVLTDIVQLASRFDVEIAVCAETHKFAFMVDNLHKASCSDIEWAKNINPKINDMQPTPSRPGCGCYYSKDWGQYSSRGGSICPHGCLYCYAQ